VSGSLWRYGIVPLALFYVVFFVFPQFSFLAVSLFASTGSGQIGGSPSAANYASILRDRFFMRAVVNTLELGVATAIACLVIAVPIAYCIAHVPRVGKYLFILVMATMFSSAVAMAIGWQTLLAPNGGFNGLLLAAHAVSEPLPLSANFTSVLIGSVHSAIPIAVLGLLPVFENLPRRQLDASVGLGASQWMTFRDVIVPQTYRGALSMGLLVFAITTSAFTTPALLGGGQVALLPLAIREQLLTSFNYPKAAALAVILIVLTVIVITMTRVLLRGGDAESMTLRPAR